MSPGADPRARPHALIFCAGTFEQMRDSLLADAPDESVCFVLARAVRTTTGRWRLVVCEVLTVTAAEYTERSPVIACVAPHAVVRVMARAAELGCAIFATHTHTSGSTVPSARDLHGEAALFAAFRRRVGHDLPHGRLIVGQQSVHAALSDDSDVMSDVDVVTVGEHVRFVPNDQALRANPLFSDVFERQVRAFGADGQAALGRLRVAIIGLGGTGSVAAQQLAYLGVNGFLLIDPETVDTTNLNRIVGANISDERRPKVDVARDSILRIAPNAHVTALQADISDSSILRLLLDVDFFFLCTDSHGSRAVVAQVAYQFLLPGIDMGVAIHSTRRGVSHIAGRVQMLAAGLPCLLCAEVLDSDAVRRDLLSGEARRADGYIAGRNVPQPAVISINSAVASTAITMFLSATTGIPLRTRNQRLRLEAGITSPIDTPVRPNCPWCTPSGALGRGDSWPMPGRAAC